MDPAPLPDGAFLDDWTARLRAAAERPVVGILLRGSHARRGATAHSDVDLDVLVTADHTSDDDTDGPVPPDDAGRGRADITRPYDARRAYLAEVDGRIRARRRSAGPVRLPVGPGGPRRGRPAGTRAACGTMGDCARS